MSIFIGRKKELKRLNRLSRLGIATLSVIKGRRRVGKSTLVKEFAKQKHFISITGIPPSSNISAQSQRNEFNNIFHDLFDDHGKPHRKILNFLTVGMKSRKQIQTELGLQSGGTISTYFKNLILAGFITEHYQWSLKTGKAGRLSLYRLSDCFIRFHLKYIQPNEARIRKGLFKKVTRGNLPGWDSIRKPSFIR